MTPQTIRDRSPIAYRSWNFLNIKFMTKRRLYQVAQAHGLQQDSILGVSHVYDLVQGQSRTSEQWISFNLAERFDKNPLEL